MARRSRRQTLDRAEEVTRAAPAPVKRAPGRPRAAAQRAIDDEPVQQVTRAGAQPAGARAPTRAPTRSAPREVDREPSRRGAVVATGREGEILSRRRTTVGDVYHVPLDEIPAGWDYQWNTYTVHNQQATDQQVLMHANGFRPVPASRHPGRWTSPGDTGQIVVSGMRLEERPTSLGNEARAEDIAKAKMQMRDQTDSLRLTEKLPSGFETKAKYRGTGGDVRISIDKALDIPRPEHQFEE